MKSANGAPFFVVQTNHPMTIADLTRSLNHGDPGTAERPTVTVLGPQRPNDVLSYDRLSTTPLLLAGVLILLAAGSAIHVLVTSVRSRRRELAMLKTMGISRRQVREAVLVQATVLVGLALIPAIPLGVVAGRWLWTLTAHWLGIAPDPITPLLAIGVIIAASVIGANLIAFIPA